MQMVTLGNTGLQVSRIGLGGLYVSKFGSEFDEACRTVSRAIELGVNYIDTAPGYSNSEEVLGLALEPIDAPVVISTKVGGRPNPFDAQDPEQIRASVDESLRLLKRDHIDILMIHEPDRQQQYNWWTDLVNVDGPVLQVLDELKASGKIMHTGLGGTTTTHMAHLCRTGKFELLLTAFNYSLLFREAAHEAIPAAKAQGMGIIAGSPLQQGAFAARYDEQISSPEAYWLSEARREQLLELYKLVDEVGLPIPELAIRFVLSNSDIDCLLMGARSAEQVEQNVASIHAGPLPAVVIEKINGIAAMVPYRPFGEPFGLGGLLAKPSAYPGLPRA